MKLFYPMEVDGSRPVSFEDGQLLITQSALCTMQYQLKELVSQEQRTLTSLIALQKQVSELTAFISAMKQSLGE